MAKHETDFCPNCGAEFRRGRLACPECGSDSETGWKSSEEVDYQSVEIPDYLGDELDGPSAGTRKLVMRVGLILALLGLAIFVFMR